MIFSQTSVFTVAMGLATLAEAHMRMANPKPYASQNTLNGPLQADGSDYPCKGDTTYDATGVSNSWATGSTQHLATIGQAVHGGGSCQISITYDKKPTKNSVFKVIHSIEGECPARGTPGNRGDDAFAANPDTYEFKIPDGLPLGDAVVAWTWFNKVGNPEMYMNCAPVTITGGSGKRSEPETDLVVRDESFLNTLPDMFKANIGSLSGNCKTQQVGQCVLFANPGASVEKNTCGFDTTQMFTGTCAAAAGPGAAPAPSSPAPAPNAPVPSKSGVPAPSNTGGVFVPANPAPATPTTMATSVVQQPPKGTGSPAPPNQQPPSQQPPSQGQPGATSCTTADYGKTVCSPDGKQVGTCDYGGKIVMGAVPAGTKCSNGNLIAVRSVSGRRTRRGQVVA
ncbi:MAG: hypothetical protein M1813_005604 [Trichoglossum hirsutum]|nr:MAG: hypothetical protein M1813_005604 [Trichoglossum hirsutum]